MFFAFLLLLLAISSSEARPDNTPPGSRRSQADGDAGQDGAEGEDYNWGRWAGSGEDNFWDLRRAGEEGEDYRRRLGRRRAGEEGEDYQGLPPLIMRDDGDAGQDGDEREDYRAIYMVGVPWRRAGEEGEDYQPSDDILPPMTLKAGEEGEDYRRRPLRYRAGEEGEDYQYLPSMKMRDDGDAGQDGDEGEDYRPIGVPWRRAGEEGEDYQPSDGAAGQDGAEGEDYRSRSRGRGRRVLHRKAGEEGEDYQTLPPLRMRAGDEGEDYQPSDDILSPMTQKALEDEGDDYCRRAGEEDGDDYRTALGGRRC